MTRASGDAIIVSTTRRRNQKGRTIMSSTTSNSTWDIPIPTIIQISSWLDQESLMNLSLVSKQLHDIIRNEPGNKNKVIPVFELSGSSTLKFSQNLHDNFLNNETAKKLQSYQIMRVKDAHKFVRRNDSDDSDSLKAALEEIVKNVQINGITSLDLYGIFSSTDDNTLMDIILPNILPKLREVNFSDMSVYNRILRKYSENCPLLEKVTSKNNGFLINLDGRDMRHSNSLKEINLDNSRFICGDPYRKNPIEDLNNHQEVFIFHRCCKTLERVSICNTKCDNGDDGTISQSAKYYDFDDDEKISQNTLIKFVRNAPPTLRWFRSDLTQDDMTMLRLERPGIDLLN
jgi:hypothetical protein